MTSAVDVAPDRTPPAGAAEDRPSPTRRERFVRFAGFPLSVWLVWRIAEIVLLEAFGGDAWNRMWSWDGKWYRVMFATGYAPIRERYGFQPTAFFPVVVWITKAVNVVVRDAGISMALVATTLSAAAFVAIYRAGLCWRNERVARYAVIGLALFPSAFFLWMWYTEALFVICSVGAFVCDKKGRHGWAAFFAGVVVMTRIPGMFVPLLLIGMRLWRTRRIDKVLVLYCCAPLTIGFVMLAQWLQAGDPIGFTHAATNWGRKPGPPWEAVVGAVRYMTRPHQYLHRWMAVIDLASAVLVTSVALWSFRRTANWPAEFGLLMLGMVMIPACTGLGLVSMTRYVLAAWPVFVICADRLARARLATLYAVVAGLTSVSLYVLFHFAIGGFIG